MCENQATMRLPPGRRVLFETNSSYKVGNVTAVVERTFAPEGSENLCDKLQRLIKSEFLNK